MKHLSATLLSVLFCITTIAQVPNGGFEDWAGNVPTGWSNNNIAPLDAYVVTPSDDAHSGSLAARGEVIVNPVLDTQVLSPVLQSIAPITLSGDPSVCTGWYQFAPAQSSVSLVMGCTVLDQDNLPTGIGILQITEAAGAYTAFSIPIDYTIGGTEPGVSATISFTLAGNNDLSTVGSVFLLDDLSLEGPLGLADDAAVSEFKSPYPSPFSSSTSIPIELETAASIQVVVLTLQGRPVHTIANRVLAPGSHLLEWTPEGHVANGVYIIRVSHPEGAIAKRVFLQR